MTEGSSQTCPLCYGANVSDYYRDNVRSYVQCGACKLVFVTPDEHLSAVEEKAYYDLHENQPNDPGYRKFLSRLFDPLNARLLQNRCTVTAKRARARFRQWSWSYPVPDV
jgi:hypothetical protein